MGCCSKKKSTKSKQLRAGQKKGAKASDKSKKGGKKPALKGAKGAKGKKGGSASSSASSKRKVPAAKGKSPVVKKTPGVAKSAPPLQRVPAEKRPTKTPSTASSTKSGKSPAGPSSASSKNTNSSLANTPADTRQAKKRESHASSLRKAGVKGKPNSASEVTTARSPQSGKDVKKGSKEPKDASKKKIVGPPPPAPPPPRDTKKKQEKQEKQADKSTSQSRGSSTTETRLSSVGATRPRRRVSRSKLPMQKLTVSSHIEDGIVVSQWYYTELRELGTQPSSVADLLQGGPRQQLNLPQPQS